MTLFKRIILLTSFYASTLLASQNTPTISVISRDDIYNSGLNNLGDIINERVNSIKTDSSNTKGGLVNQFTNIEQSNTSINLQGIGSNRVLILLNSNPMVTKQDGSFDFSIVPLSIIEEIRIDFSNAEYKTTGISAVVDIITRKDANELETSAYYGVSDKGDAETQNYNISYGKSFEKGNLFFNIEYAKNSPIHARDRNISALPVYGTGYSSFSDFTPQGLFYFIDPDNNEVFATTPYGSDGFNEPNDPDLIPYNREYGYNYQNERYLLTPQQRKSGFLSFQTHFNEHTILNSNILVNQRKSSSQQAPDLLLLNPLIGANNPYNPYDNDFELFILARRMQETGNRIIESSVNNHIIDLNLESKFRDSESWGWKLGFVQSKYDESQKNSGFTNIENIIYALSNECVTDSGCVPLNLFGGEGTITPEMVNYIHAPATNTFDNKSTIFTASVSGDVFQNKAGIAKLKTEYQHQYQKGKANYDPIINQAINSHPYRNNLSSEGSFDLNRLMNSMNIPLYNQDKQNLSLNLYAGIEKFHKSDSEFSGGLSVEFSPHSSVTATLSYKRINRAPVFTELFNNYSEYYGNYFVSEFDDACLDDLTLPGCPDSIQEEYTNTVYPVIRNNIGNENLDMEHWENINFSINYSPAAINGLSLQFMAYSRETDNHILNLNSGEIVYTCIYQNLNCDRVIRDDTLNLIRQVNAGFVNYGYFKNRGIHLNINYEIETEFANFAFQLQNMYTDQLKYDSPEFDSQYGSYEIYDYTSIYPVTAEIPQLKSNLYATMTKGNWSLNYQARYISGQDEICNPNFNDNIQVTSDPNAPGGIVPADFQWCTDYLSPDYDEPNLRHVSGATFHDLNISYQLKSINTRFTLGIDNLFDKAPPLSSSTTYNNFNSNLYNGRGRYFWLRIIKNFK